MSWFRKDPRANGYEDPKDYNELFIADNLRLLDIAEFSTNRELKKLSFDRLRFLLTNTAIGAPPEQSETCENSLPSSPLSQQLALPLVNDPSQREILDSISTQSMIMVEILREMKGIKDTGHSVGDQEIVDAYRDFSELSSETSPKDSKVAAALNIFDDSANHLYKEKMLKHFKEHLEIDIPAHLVETLIDDSCYHGLPDPKDFVKEFFVFSRENSDIEDKMVCLESFLDSRKDIRMESKDRIGLTLTEKNVLGSPKKTDVKEVEEEAEV